MNKAEIYLRAAESEFKMNPAQDGSCCWSIAEESPSYREGKELKEYQESAVFALIFAPKDKEYAYWGKQWGIDSDLAIVDWEQVRKCRVLALCFAAAMAKTGDI